VAGRGVGAVNEQRFKPADAFVEGDAASPQRPPATMVTARSRWRSVGMRRRSQA